MSNGDSSSGTDGHAGDRADYSHSYSNADGVVRMAVGVAGGVNSEIEVVVVMVVTLMVMMLLMVVMVIVIIDDTDNCNVLTFPLIMV